jgi:hypothetical protein
VNVSDVIVEGLEQALEENLPETLPYSQSQGLGRDRNSQDAENVATVPTESLRPRRHVERQHFSMCRVRNSMHLSVLPATLHFAPTAAPLLRDGQRAH